MSMRGWLRIWRVGHGDVFGAILDLFGLGGGAGRVCALCLSQVGFRVPFLSTYVSLCSSFFRSSEGAKLHNIKIIGFKRASDY
jgi:hypothetical protein